MGVFDDYDMRINPIVKGPDTIFGLIKTVLGVVGGVISSGVDAVTKSGNNGTGELGCGYIDKEDWLSDKPQYGNEKELEFWLNSGGTEEAYWKYAENRAATLESIPGDIEDRFIEDGQWDPNTGEIVGPGSDTSHWPETGRYGEPGDIGNWDFPLPGDTDDWVFGEYDNGMD